MKKEIKNAIEVLQKATANCAQGDRHIVVLDRGWIFAGDMSLDKETNVYTLSNCVNIRKWETGGFGGLTLSAKVSKATLNECSLIRFHASAMIFCVPIDGDWDE